MRRSTIGTETPSTLSNVRRRINDPCSTPSQRVRQLTTASAATTTRVRSVVTRPASTRLFGGIGRGAGLLQPCGQFGRTADAESSTAGAQRGASAVHRLSPASMMTVSRASSRVPSSVIHFSDSDDAQRRDSMSRSAIDDRAEYVRAASDVLVRRRLPSPPHFIQTTAEVHEPP